MSVARRDILMFGSVTLTSILAGCFGIADTNEGDLAIQNEAGEELVVTISITEITGNADLDFERTIRLSAGETKKYAGILVYTDDFSDYEFVVEIDGGAREKHVHTVKRSDDDLKILIRSPQSVEFMTNQVDVGWV